MFWFFWIPRDKDSDGRPFSMIPFFSILCLITLSCLIIFSMSFVFYLFPYPGSFNEFAPAGQINLRLSQVSDTNGYSLLFITEDGEAILSTPVTKTRYQEMEYLYETEPETMYCLQAYHTASGDLFISTYDDQDTEDAWEDYKHALQDSSVHKNIGMIIFLGFLILLFLALTIIVFRAIFRYIRGRNLKTTLETEGKIMPDAPEELSETPAISNDLSDEIDNFDPQNASWHK